MAGNKKDGNKRTLVRWSDDLDKQLLLSIQYACNEAGLRIPWDIVARLMGEKFSDGAIVQHMAKLRQKMVENDLPVPPPLKRGTTVVPSKIYATSGTARRKSMPDIPNTASPTVSTPKPKQAVSKKRTRRSGLESDSDSQLEEDNMDIADTSDDEYGVSGRKKKRQQRLNKAKQVARKKTTQEPSKPVNEDQVKEEDNEVAASQIAEENVIKESIEIPGPLTRTRGIRADYSKLEQTSDEEGNEGNAKDRDVESAEIEEVVTEEDDPKIKSDGDVSPRSRVQASPVTPAQLMNLPFFHDSPHSSNSAATYSAYPATRVPYHSTQNNFLPAPSTAYFPRSDMTSFSTGRNDSTSSVSSSMPPAFSTQSSFGYAAMGQRPLPGHIDYLNQGGLDFRNFGGFDNDLRHGGRLTAPEDEDERDFASFLARNRQI